uniref:Uncharacterized protein n=1 Tax=Lygus hesperus TaxID=30085 RepID=A0A146ME93_LYGHE
MFALFDAYPGAMMSIFFLHRPPAPLRAVVSQVLGLPQLVQRNSTHFHPCPRLYLCTSAQILRTVNGMRNLKLDALVLTVNVGQPSSNLRPKIYRKFLPGIPPTLHRTTTTMLVLWPLVHYSMSQSASCVSANPPRLSHYPPVLVPLIPWHAAGTAVLLVTTPRAPPCSPFCC